MSKGKRFTEEFKLEAVKQVVIRVESAKRLAALGGKAPKMKEIPRRQAKVFQDS